MARWSRSVKWEGLRWDGELGFGFYRRGVRRCRFGAERTDLGGQALGWRQRRFRGRCESGDGVDALGGEGGGSDGRIRTTGAQAGAVKVGAASWRSSTRAAKSATGDDAGGVGQKEKEGVHFTHTTLLTRITQPVEISHVGGPPSFHDKTFRKPTQVYHMPTRGVPDQQQVRSQNILCQEAQGSSPTPPRRIHMSLGIKAPLAQDVQRWLALLEIWSLILEILALRVFGLRNYTQNGTTQQTAKIKPY
uniref:OSJNBb0034I13.17 protein n=1 Tax=Oryza sativa subsp. japonica TaxID=39947 RepID=Q7XNC8_ORYSJ|nr:OSJNBb0034I13.17 [Oryza sativa Japonica Group]